MPRPPRPTAPPRLQRPVLSSRPPRCKGWTGPINGPVYARKGGRSRPACLPDGRNLDGYGQPVYARRPGHPYPWMVPLPGCTRARGIGMWAAITSRGDRARSTRRPALTRGGVAPSSGFHRLTPSGSYSSRRPHRQPHRPPFLTGTRTARRALPVPAAYIPQSSSPGNERAADQAGTVATGDLSSYELRCNR